MADPYDLYVFHRSYFCGKILGYLRYKEIPHNALYKSRAEVGETLMRETGLRQMPVMRTPDARWMQDTTPMIEWLEQQHPEPSILTGDPVNDFFLRLIEDYADEWLWKPAVFSRWENAPDGHYYRSLFTREFVGGIWATSRPLTWIGGKLLQHYLRGKHLYGDGITPANREFVWSIYTGTLDRLERILADRPYLLGEKPCFADFGFFGSMFWHFSNDPTPNRIMQERAPGVNEWVARLWNMTATKAKGKGFTYHPGAAPEAWGELIADVCGGYLPYLHENALAFAAGKARFDPRLQGVKFPRMRVSPYRVWCRENLQGHLASLTASERKAVRAVLEPLGGWAPLTDDAEIKSGYDPDGLLPFCTSKEPTWKYRLLSPFIGSSHVESRRHDARL